MNRFKPADGRYTGIFTNTPNSKQVNTALAGLSNLRKVDVDNYRRNLQRHSSARQLPLAYISELFNPNMNADLDSVVGKFGSPIEKAIFSTARQNADKQKTTSNSFRELRNAAETFDQHFRLRASKSVVGTANQSFTLDESDRIEKQFKKLK